MIDAACTSEDVKVIGFSEHGSETHGGFEKGHRATIYLHTPGLGALPVGLSSIHDSPLFSFTLLRRLIDSYTYRQDRIANMDY